MKKLLFVFNPNAGKSTIKESLCDIIDIFTKGGYEVTAYPTQARLDGFQKILEDASKYDLVVSSGGDGTMSESIKGIMNSGANVPIGYIPAGTVNDFAHSMDISKNMIDAANAVVKGVPFAYDVGSFNGDYFCYVAAFGAFTDVSYETPQSTKNIFGHLAYLMEGVKRIKTLEAYDITVEHDGEVYRDDFIVGLISNTISIAGLSNLVAEGVVFDDGLFEVTLIKTPNSPLELSKILNCIIMKNLDPKYFYTFKTSRVRFTSEQEIKWTLDGESGGSYTVADIEAMRQAVKIIVEPPKEKE
ncbi:MAG: diacylglycerol kinase family lipid kinase [Oscillospiraceae bacterium]|nr:diacylglycerol kinase family lipid kinase [Oscillospiraceae bacterium]MBQ8378865.1 diacylglycerol kinase family lipid kinase [Oscillospiraceae bacterium]MBQ8883523.1 diacylglycerol kinase family lipid kinase [Oscillospiraceae bacterium]